MIIISWPLLFILLLFFRPFRRFVGFIILLVIIVMVWASIASNFP